MKPVSIIKNGILYKHHGDYDVTNARWKRMNVSLVEYLKSLHLLRNHFDEFVGVDMFYLRLRKNDVLNDYNLDPWERQFYSFPGKISFIKDLTYRYYSYVSDELNRDVYVIVTTVCGDRVYCVDIVE